MLRLPLHTLASVGLILFSSLAAQAEGPLDLIPKDASVVVRVKSPQATIAKVAGFVNAVQPGMGFVVQSQAAALGVGISNPTMGGVDLRNDWYIAVFTVKNAEPAVVFLVPATKGTEDRSGVDQMKEAVGDQFTFASKDNWVAYSMDEAVIELVEDCIDDAGESVALDRRSNEVFDNSDISVFVNIGATVGTYEDELKAGEEQIDIALEGIGAELQNADQGFNLAPIMEIYGQMARGALQGVRDSDALTVGVTVDSDALVIEELLLVEADSGSDKFLQSHPTDELAVLNRLPQDKLGYFAMHGDFTALAKWGMEFAVKVMGDNDDTADVKEKLEKISATMNEIEFGSAAWAFGLGDGDKGILEGYAISQATPAAKVQELSRLMGQGYNINVPGVKQEFSVEKGAEKYGDLSADIIRIKQEFDETADPLGVQKKLQSVLYGDNGIEQRVVVKDENHVVQTFGGGKAAMEELIEAAGSADASSDSAVGKARSGLMEKANVVGLIDLPNLALKIGRAALANEDIAANAPVKLKHLEGITVPASFIGFAAGTEAQGVRFRTEIPSKTFQNFAQIAAYVQQMKIKEAQEERNSDDDF